MQENERRCNQLGRDIQNKRLQISYLEDKLQRILSDINPTLREMDELREEIRNAENMNTLNAATNALSNRNRKKGIAEGFVSYATNWPEVRAMQGDYNRLHTKFDVLVSDQKYYEDLIDETHDELRDLEEEYRNSRC